MNRFSLFSNLCTPHFRNKIAVLRYPRYLVHGDNKEKKKNLNGIWLIGKE
jgi:hypothetical protein